MKWTFIDNENESTNIEDQKRLAKKFIANRLWLEKVIMYRDMIK